LKIIHTYIENSLDRNRGIKETRSWRTAYTSHEDTNFMYLY